MDETIEVADVHLFVAVARQASFAGASRRTGVPTSTLSRAVARLEEALGVRLLHRTSRRVSLTHEGAWLLERAAPHVEGIREALDNVADSDDSPAGRLRVTAPVVTGSERIGQALMAYAAAHPRVSVDLHLTNAVVNLVAEGFDLAFRAGPVADGDLVARRLWSVPFALAASPGFVERALAGRRTIGAALLAEVPAIVTRPGMTWRFRRADGAASEVRPREHFSVNDPRVAIEAAKAGLGVVRAPRDAIAREAGALVMLEAELGEVEAREMFAVYPSRRFVPRRVRAAVTWVVRAAGEASARAERARGRRA